jgi:hypothetical protein
MAETMTSTLDIEDDLFLMTNLFPASTGLPMVIWVGPGLGLSHQALRIKVMQSHGARMDAGNLAEVTLRPYVDVIAGHLDPDDLEQVKAWIALNQPAVIAHCEGRIDGAQFTRRIRRLPKKS